MSLHIAHRLVSFSMCLIGSMTLYTSLASSADEEKPPNPSNFRVGERYLDRGTVDLKLVWDKPTGVGFSSVASYDLQVAIATDSDYWDPLAKLKYKNVETFFNVICGSQSASFVLHCSVRSLESGLYYAFRIRSVPKTGASENEFEAIVAQAVPAREAPNPTAIRSTNQTCDSIVIELDLHGVSGRELIGKFGCRYAKITSSDGTALSKVAYDWQESGDYNATMTSVKVVLSHLLFGYQYKIECKSLYKKGSGTPLSYVSSDAVSFTHPIVVKTKTSKAPRPMRVQTEDGVDGGSLVVTWSKVLDGVEHDGFEIELERYDPTQPGKFVPNSKTTVIASKKETRKIVTGLVEGALYEVRLRTIAGVDARDHCDGEWVKKANIIVKKST